MGSTMVDSYRLSILTNVLSNHSAASCHRMSAMVKSTGASHFGQNLGRERLTNVRQILTQSGRANGLRSPLVSARAVSLHRTHLLLAWIGSWIGR